MSFEKLYGYTEPIRRLIQREDFAPQANEIPNTRPSWLPGDDYLINFRKGDPSSKIDQGYARLPGAGYAAVHPELKDVKPENYPDIYRLSILADVAPYSREYNIVRQAVAKEAQDNTQLNGKLRDECLNTSGFWNLFDARRRISAWKTEYNSRRPHSSLGYLTPEEFARQCQLRLLPAASGGGIGFEFSEASAIYRPVGFRAGSGALVSSAPVLSPSR